MNLPGPQVKLVVALILLLCAPAVKTDSIFPMDIGSYWLYKGKTGWSRPGAAAVEENALRWSSEVVGRDEPNLHA